MACPVGGTAHARSGRRMLNLVEKFTPRNSTSADDSGVVAIEYVLVAGFVAVGVGVAFATTDLWQDLKDMLDSIPI